MTVYGLLIVLAWLVAGLLVWALVAGGARKQDP